MPEQAVCNGKLLSMARSRSAQWEFPILDSVSATSSMVDFISHDLRHPLTAILANAEFLTRPNTDQEFRNDCYQEIRWAVDRMNNLISSLQEFSRGRDTFRLARQNIVSSIARAIRLASAKEEFRDITIQHQHSGATIGWFDTDRMERVIANLVLNACEAVSAQSGHVVITSAGDRASLRIGVWDNGPGVPAAIRDSIFEPFVSYGKTNGSGLGLAIAKKIVEDHRGRIRLDENTCCGTLFRITIPIGCSPAASVP